MTVGTLAASSHVLLRTAPNSPSVIIATLLDVTTASVRVQFRPGGPALLFSGLLYSR